jgi:hypothetical protein
LYGLLNVALTLAFITPYRQFTLLLVGGRWAEAQRSWKNGNDDHHHRSSELRQQQKIVATAAAVRLQRSGKVGVVSSREPPMQKVRMQIRRLTK